MRLFLARLLRFASVGTMGTVLQLAVLAALEGVLQIHYLAATALAVETAVVHNFLWHERWTWADREGKSGSPSRFLKFHGTTGLVSILGNLAFMRLFVGELSLHPVAGNIASIACCAALNFVLNDRVVFVTQSVMLRAGTPNDENLSGRHGTPVGALGRGEERKDARTQRGI